VNETVGVVVAVGEDDPPPPQPEKRRQARKSTALVRKTQWNLNDCAEKRDLTLVSWLVMEQSPYLIVISECFDSDIFLLGKIIPLKRFSLSIHRIAPKTEIEA
jgi:hypothetical protein